MSTQDHAMNEKYNEKYSNFTETILIHIFTTRFSLKNQGTNSAKGRTLKIAAKNNPLVLVEATIKCQQIL